MMKLWQVVTIWAVVTFLTVSIGISLIISLTTSAVKQIENNGGLKSVTHDIWEGKPKQ